jgi:hypothetical protein
MFYFDLFVNLIKHGSMKYRTKGIYQKPILLSISNELKFRLQTVSNVSVEQCHVIVGIRKSIDVPRVYIRFCIRHYAMKYSTINVHDDIFEATSTMRILE